MEPFFTIILPTYNRAHMLEKAVDSLTKQVYPNWELIVVDDGSTDNTKEVIEQKYFHNKQIVYIYQDNAERSAARNNGIKNARGQYICFLDSDDEYAENHLSTLHNEITKRSNPVGIFYTGVSIIDQENKKKDIPLIKNKFEDYSTFFFVESIIPTRMCIHKSILEEFQFDIKTKISEDTQLWVKIVDKYDAVFPIDAPTAIYHQHDDNSVNYKRYNAYYDRKNTLIKILKSDSGKKVNNLIASRVINDCYFGIFKFYYYNNMNVKAFLTIMKSFFALPRYRSKEKIYLALNSFNKDLRP